MTLKQASIVLGILLTMGPAIASHAKGNGQDKGPMPHQGMMSHMDDGRTSLGLPPQMRMRQLSNMRSHLAAIQNIIGLIGENDLISASKIAHSKLGLTDEMKRMCNMFQNPDFRRLGLSFHKSADTLGDVLETKDVERSLAALHTTMGYCVQCHARFRQ